MSATEFEGFIDARCFCYPCRDRTEDVYRMVSGLCSNCGSGPYLILYRAGDRAHDRDCPFCHTYWSVKPLRRATPDEIPAAAPPSPEQKQQP